MRTAAAFLVVVLASAAPTFAQETQQEIAERLFREQEDQRRNALEKVMSAPARALDHGGGSFEIENLTETAGAKPPAPAGAPAKSRGRKFPWLVVACLLPIIPLAILGFEKGRRWWRELR